MSLRALSVAAFSKNQLLKKVPRPVLSGQNVGERRQGIGSANMFLGVSKILSVLNASKNV